MAQYSQLPIYNKAFAVLREFYIRVPNFNQQYRYFLGGELTKGGIEIIKLIIQANNERNAEVREKMIAVLCTNIEILITHLRIANDLKQLGGQRVYLYL